MKLTTTTTTILLSTLGTTSAYLAQVNNAHVEFLSSNEAAATTTVDLNTDKNIDVPEAEQEQQQPALPQQQQQASASMPQHQAAAPMNGVTNHAGSATAAAPPVVKRCDVYQRTFDYVQQCQNWTSQQ